MSLFVIGDLHLHFQSELKARGQLIAPVWKNHEERFLNNCRRMVGPRDTLVLAGDHSWGRNMDECARDFEYILSLPGRKILLRGNHDMFWDAKKTAALNERFAGRLFFLQNNYASYNDYALVGTKGFTFEGPLLSGQARPRRGLGRGRGSPRAEAGGARGGTPARFLRSGAERRIPKVHYVPPLPAHQHA